jgi:D-2-hydroxyacid dehydrogenase (NADP+)
MSNVVVSPHIAGWTPRYFDRAFGIFEENLRRFSKGERLLNLVEKNIGY